MAITYGGTTLTYAHGETDPLERAVKEVGYPGVDGLDWMDLGSRGRRFVVRGFSTGTPSKSTLDGLNNGATATLAINGASYSNVLCLGFWFTDCPLGFFFTGQFRQVEE